MLDNKAEFPHLSRLLSVQLEVAPGHEKFLRRRLQSADGKGLQVLEELACYIQKLVEGQERKFAEDYAWLCENQLEEELYFRRHGRYRLQSFAQALAEVYSDAPYMARYMGGLLLTQLWWRNHSDAISFYRTRFLASNPDGYSHLEIGPGHGLLLYFAATDPKCRSINGWDVSDASIRMTADSVMRLGAARAPTLELMDLFDAPPAAKFDSVVFSEVLEHMEDPVGALKCIRATMSERGRLYIHMPINSPAPDHLFNVPTPEDLEAFIASTGFQVLDREYFPATNYSLETARELRLTISCVLIASPQ